MPLYKSTARKFTIGETSREVNGVYEVSWDLDDLNAAARSGLNAFGNWNINILGTSPRWETPRMFTIGNTTKYVDGSQNVSWTLNELGVGNFVTTDTTQTISGAKTFSSPVVSPRINIQRVNNTASGISWYNSASYTAWADYMAQAGQTSVGPTGNITAPTGTLVTSWGMRSFIENNAGFGWTFESGTTSQTTPTIVAEIRSSDGAARFGGNVTAGGTLAVTGTTATAGHFYAGTTNPTGTTRLNYNGNLHTTNIQTTSMVTSSGGIFENSSTITSSYTIKTGHNAVSAGPITINDGVTITVPDGSRWVIT